MELWNNGWTTSIPLLTRHYVSILKYEVSFSFHTTPVTDEHLFYFMDKEMEAQRE